MSLYVWLNPAGDMKNRCFVSFCNAFCDLRSAAQPCAASGAANVALCLDHWKNSIVASDHATCQCGFETDLASKHKPLLAENWIDQMV